MKPVKIVNTLWDHASKMVVPPQLAIVIVSEADGICAFRHNCEAGLPALAAVLRQFADQLVNGDARGVLTEVPAGTTGPEPNHCGRDPGRVGTCGGTDATCSCECTICEDPR